MSPPAFLNANPTRRARRPTVGWAFYSNNSFAFGSVPLNSAPDSRCARQAQAFGCAGVVMKARQLIAGAGAGYSPDELATIFEAFYDAWAEVAPNVSTDAIVVEAARLSLATIVVELAAVGPIERAGLKEIGRASCRERG